MKKKNRKRSKRRRIITALFSVAILITAISIIVLTASLTKSEAEFARLREEMMDTYGENQVISNNGFDRTLAGPIQKMKPPYKLGIYAVILLVTVLVLVYVYPKLDVYPNIWNNYLLDDLKGTGGVL